MRKIYILLTWSFFIASLSGCSDEEAENSADALDAKLVAVIEGSEKELTVFEENSDIRFYLKLINNSGEDTDAGGIHGFCALYNVEEYLLIYKWAKKDGDEKESWIPLGKPYVSPVNCLQNFLPLTIPAKGEIGVAAASWRQNPDNQPLTPGKYFTALSYTLPIGKKSKKLDLRLDFEVR